MNVTEWLSKLTDFVNLGKTLVDAGPGTLLAVALFVLLTHTSQIPIAEFTGQFDKSIKDQSATVTTDGHAVGIVEARKARAEAEMTQRTTDIAEVTGLIAEARKQPAAQARENELIKQRDKLRNGSATREGPMDCDNLAPKAVGWGLVQWTEERAELEKCFAMKKEVLAASSKELEKLQAERILTSDHLLTHALNHLVVLGLMGYLLGTLMSPLNRALFLNLVDDLRLPWFGDFLLQKYQTITGFGPTDGFEYRQQVEAARTRKGTLAATAQDEILLRPPTYYVGIGLISQTEVDGFTASHYRLVEVAINLIVPVLALGIAIDIALVRHDWLIWLTLLVCWLLFLIGRRRYLSYNRDLRLFILGRLQHLEDETKNAADKATQQVAATAAELAKIVRKLLAEQQPAPPATGKG